MIFFAEHKIIEIGENYYTEFKRCGKGIESDVYETVCSFSNHYGGNILCGVLDDGSINGIPKKAAESMVKNFVSVISNHDLFSPTIFLEPEVINVNGKSIIFIHVPASAEVHTYKKIIYDRINDSDVKVTSTSRIAEMYIRKQNIFTEQKVFKYVTLKELKTDIIDMCRKLAVIKNENHPWKSMSDKELLISAHLYAQDWQTGEKGINLAGILLLGKDDVIGSVCPAYKTDALVRRINVDRYDDREIVKTNLIDSYNLLIEFAQKHLPDKFFMEGVQTVSLRDKIVREMVSNILMHREFTSTYVSKIVIEKEQIFSENPCRARSHFELTPDTFTPNSKNPIIASFFNNIGYADELGSGTRNLFKYTKLYSGKNPRMIEDDIFQVFIPLDENYSADFDIRPLSPTAEKIEKPETELSDVQKKIIVLMKKNPKITAEQMSTKLKISTRAVQSHIKILRDSGKVVRTGGNKFGTWVVRKD